MSESNVVDLNKEPIGEVNVPHVNTNPPVEEAGVPYDFASVVAESSRASLILAKQQGLMDKHDKDFLFGFAYYLGACNGMNIAGNICGNFFKNPAAKDLPNLPFLQSLGSKFQEIIRDMSVTGRQSVTKEMGVSAEKVSSTPEVPPAV